MSTENRNDRRTIMIKPNNNGRGYIVAGNHDTTAWQIAFTRTQEPAINF